MTLRRSTPPRLRALALAAVAALALAVPALAVPASAHAQAGRRTTVLDVNTAGEQALRALPHMTPALARAIVARRPFLRMTELDSALAGTLTPAQRTALYGRLFLQVNLRTAPDAEILLIPGLGQRMLHEFHEYRPYVGGLPRFRREIGKYVDAAEVARLEQYVFLPIDLNTASDADILSIPGVGPRLLREFKEYRPYRSLEQFRREIGKYVDAREVARLERYVTIGGR
jgi:DNA uptake protein ComE-like DNA-binding protein